MANLFIGGIDSALLKALKVKCAQEGITLKQLVVPLLEMLADSKPIVVDGDFVYGTAKPMETDPDWAKGLAARRVTKR